eukprot:jgi/Ulvmu1/10923/UM007_0102.1
MSCPGASNTRIPAAPQPTTMPFSLPEPQRDTSFLPHASDIFAQSGLRHLKSLLPHMPSHPQDTRRLDTTICHAYSSRHYPASDIHSSHKPGPGPGCGSAAANGLAEDLQLLSVNGTDDARSLSTSPSPSPRPPGSRSAPYAPFPQSAVTLPSLRASCCASSGIFSDTSSDFPSSATYTADASPGRSTAGPPWSGVSPPMSLPLRSVAGGPAAPESQTQSPSCTMPKACDIRSPRPSSRRPARNPFRSPPPSVGRAAGSRDRRSMPSSMPSRMPSSAHEDTALLKNLQASFTASLENTKVKRHLRRATPLSARRPGESSSRRSLGGTCSAPASEAGPQAPRSLPAIPVSQGALMSAVEQLRLPGQASLDTSGSKRASQEQGETRLLLELREMFAHEVQRKNKVRRHAHGI